MAAPSENMSAGSDITARRRSCPLERLNTDTLLGVLSASNSLADLNALIRASPLIYHSFLLAKASTLVRVMTNELGFEGVRDAAVLAHTERFTSDDLLDVRIPSTASEYHRLSPPRHGLGAPQVCLTSLPVDTVISMVKLTRAAVLIGDIYGAIRFHWFTTAIRRPWSITPAERRRIAQALIRYQIIINMNGGTRWEVEDFRDTELLYSTVKSLFEPWELEQVSQMDKFFGSLCNGLLDCQGKRPGGPKTSAVWVGHVFALGQYCPSIEVMREKLLEAVALEGPVLLDELKTPIIGSEPLCGETMEDTLGLFTRLASSRRFKKSPDDFVWPTAESAAWAKLVGFDGDSVSSSEPTWAWVQAFEGQEFPRWGVEAGPHSGITYGGYPVKKEAFSLWRWLGLVFWDQERVKELLGFLDTWVPGWLASYNAELGSIIFQNF